ncbi:MAG: arginine--tRNA ligase [Clostridia bacterium]|nr:arginine--tRNA ligase [Clostridia bacterium]
MQEYGIYLKAKNQVRQTVTDALAKLIADGQLPQVELPAFNVEQPAERKNGDFSANIAMVGARAFRLPPRKIAELLTGAFALENTYFERVEVAGPGFINFYLGRRFYADVVIEALEQKENYGRSDFGEGKSVLLEFVSANPTGPAHMGNARGGALGDCLASIMDAAGYRVAREFYVNDAGNQIEKLGLSLEVRYLQQLGEEIELPEDAYHGEDVVRHAKDFIAQYGDTYKNAEQAERRKALVAFALPRNIDALKANMDKYRIVYDQWFRESTLHNNGEVARIIDLFKTSGHTYEKDGALWFAAKELGADDDFVLVRANGIPTYVVPDIAYHYNKLAVRGFDYAIDVLGCDHHAYVPRLKAALKALDIDPDRLIVILMQLVRLTRDGEVVRMSKRTGKAITLADLLDDIPIDAVRFLFNMRTADSQMEFDLGLAVEQSSQNPVYYTQYAHARICSILKNLAAEGITLQPTSVDELALLTTPEEEELISLLAAFQTTVIDSAKSHDPSGVTRYAINLATAFHKFYTMCKVNCGNSTLCNARLSLCMSVRIALHNVLSMLKIDTPETM